MLIHSQVGEMRRAGAPDTPESPSSKAGESIQRSSSASQPQQEPVVAKSQHALAQGLSRVDLRDTEAMDIAKEAASASQEPKEAQKLDKAAKPSKAAESKRAEAAQAEQAQSATAAETQQAQASTEAETQQSNDQAMVDVDQEAMEAEAQRKIARIKKAYREAGRPVCTVFLPDGSVCGGYHPIELHDEKKAVEAKAVRDARSLLQERAPDALRPPLTEAETKEKVKQKKQKSRDKRTALRLQVEEAKKASKETGTPKEADPKAKELAPGELCPKCHNRHKGECRKCSCGGWHKEANCPRTGKKGDKPKPAVDAAKPQPRTNTGNKALLPAMDRDELIQEASFNVRSEAGKDQFMKLMNAGARPGTRPVKQQPHSFAAAAKNGNGGQ